MHGPPLARGARYRLERCVADGTERRRFHQCCHTRTEATCIAAGTVGAVPAAPIPRMMYIGAAVIPVVIRPTLTPS